ncbi:MAG TPA: hypothetical protein VHP81_07845 [Lachnospiraceae bacterium]|nr:hypothetical protein [Lachnospiraceae bacterium]
MKVEALVYEDCINPVNYIKLIKFLSDISDKVTFIVPLNSYTKLQEEYDEIISDLDKEYKLEGQQRRLRYEQDQEYRFSLLNIYKSEEEVLSYFNRYESYDVADFEEVQQKIKHYISHCQIPLPDINIRSKKILPELSFWDSKFTMYSECYTGGLYKIYNFQMDSNMINYLLNEGDLTKVASFKNIEWIQDPAFYRNNNLVCSVCSHEHYIELILNDENYEVFKSLNIKVWECD